MCEALESKGGGSLVKLTKRFTNVNTSYSREVHVCGFVKCSDLVAPHELCTETGKPAKESEKCEAVFS